MKFDEKTEKRHKAAIRKLVARQGLGITMKHEIAYELRKSYHIDFDLNYIHRLILEIENDMQREFKYLASPEGQVEFAVKHALEMAKLNKLEAKIRGRKN